MEAHLEKKYYQPTIEEFHVGFEYERCDGGYSWIKDIYPRASENTKLERLIPYTRVKALDREDIESLEIDDSVHIEFYEFVGENEPNIIIKPKSIYNPFFKGTIKNKSELKRILKQIGV
jgi:hypothetical protein